MALSLEHLNRCMQVCFHAKRLSRSQLSPAKIGSAENASFPRRGLLPQETRICSVREFYYVIFSETGN